MRAGYLRGALSPQATQRQMDVLVVGVVVGGSVADAAELVGNRPSTVKTPTSWPDLDFGRDRHWLQRPTPDAVRFVRAAT